MRQAATKANPAQGRELRMSQQDALLAHVWRAIAKARTALGAEYPTHLDMAIDIRTVLRPHLPPGFIGCGVVIFNVCLHHDDVENGSIGDIADKIRHAITRFDHETVRAYLHEAALEPNPQRLWQAFMGSQHLIVSSTTRFGFNEIDFFGKGENLLLAHHILPQTDGIVHVGRHAKTEEWEVVLSLEKTVMEHLLSDGGLWVYE